MSSQSRPGAMFRTGEKLLNLHWFLLLTIVAIAVFGAAMQFSVNQNEPDQAQMPIDHILRFGLTLAIAIGMGVTPLRYWASIAYPAYFVALLLLVDLIKRIDIEDKMPKCERFLEAFQVGVLRAKK